MASQPRIRVDPGRRRPTSGGPRAERRPELRSSNKPRTVTPSKRPEWDHQRPGSAREDRQKTREDRQRSGSVGPVDRVSMLVMEANEISQCLGKDYIFRKHDEITGDENEAAVCVTNSKFGIECHWSLAKLKERLVKMRKLVYEDDMASSGYNGESVFYDPKDEWRKCEQSDTSFNVPLDSNCNGVDAIDRALEILQNQPVKAHMGVSYFTKAPEQPKRPSSVNLSSTTRSSGSFTGLSTGSSTGTELPGDSVFIPTATVHSPTTGPGSSSPHSTNQGTSSSTRYSTSHGNSHSNGTSTVLPEKYLSSNRSRTRDPTRKQSTTVAPPRTSQVPTSTPPTHSIPSHTNQSNSLSSAESTPTTTPRTSTHSTPASTPKSSPTHSAKFPKVISTSTASHGYGLQLRPMKAPPKRASAGIQTSPEPQGASMLTLCKEMIGLTLERLKRRGTGSGNKEEYSLVDRILSSCESIKVAVVNLLDGYIQARETGDSAATFASSDLVRATCLQLVTALELLVSQASVWTAMYAGLDTPGIQGISSNITGTVTKLATELLSFVQCCELDDDTDSQELSTNILTSLYDLVKHCGVLAVVTETRVTSLRETDGDGVVPLMSGNMEEDLVQSPPSSDLKQAFLMGVNQYVDQSLEGSIANLVQCEKSAEAFTPGGSTAAQQEEASAAILKHVYIVVGTSKLLVLKCQQIQVELDTDLREDLSRGDDYYERYYHRSQGLVYNVNALTDSVSLLVQATEPLDTDPDPGDLRKICRCCEMVQRGSQRILAGSQETNTSTHLSLANSLNQSVASSINQSVLSSLNGLSLDLTSLESDQSESSILTSEQNDQLERSTEDVKLATEALVELTKKELALKGDCQDGKIKRMLPATPSNRHPLVRCRSARSADKHRLNRNISMKGLGDASPEG